MFTIMSYRLISRHTVLTAKETAHADLFFVILHILHQQYALMHTYSWLYYRKISENVALSLTPSVTLFNQWPTLMSEDSIFPALKAKVQ